MNHLSAITSIAPFLLLGLVFLGVAHTRRGMAFGQTVDVDFARSPAGRSILRRYRGVQLALLAALVAARILIPPFRDRGAPAWIVIGLLLYVAASACVWAIAFSRTRTYAVRLPLVRTASLFVDRRLERLLLAACLPLAAAAAVLRIGWRRIPASIPSHWNAAGVVDHWTPRTPLSVAAPLLVALLPIALFWLILRYATPGSGRGRSLLPALAWCLALLAAAWSLMPLRTEPSSLPIALLIATPLLILLIVGVSIMASLRRSVDASGDGTPNERWVGGMFYYNPRDPALWVEKRMGIGWTLNFARPASWVFMGGALLVIALSLGLAVLYPSLRH